MTPGAMSSQISLNTKREVILKMRERYGRRGRLLDELCEYGRKHAIKLLGGKLPVAGENGRRGGARRRYGEAERAVLKDVLGCQFPESDQSVRSMSSGLSCFSPLTALLL